MVRINLLLLSLIFIALLAPEQLIAQEEDPYTDYSYLWEDTKKKKKKKDKSSETVQETNLPAESAPGNTEPINAIPTDSAVVNNDVLTEPSTEPDESLEGEEDIVPKEKKSAASGDDFRAGLTGSKAKNTINASLGYTNIAGDNFVA